MQNEFMRSSFLPKCKPKITRISALPNKQEPCPFGSGLALDPVVVFFFKNAKKYKWWPDPIL